MVFFKKVFNILLIPIPDGFWGGFVLSGNGTKQENCVTGIDIKEITRMFAQQNECKRIFNHFLFNILLRQKE